MKDKREMEQDAVQRKKLTKSLADLIYIWASSWDIDLPIDAERDLAKRIYDSEQVLDLLRIQSLALPDIYTVICEVVDRIGWQMGDEVPLSKLQDL